LLCFGLFLNSSVCFSCFYIGSKHQNPKQTEMFCFWFHETNRNTTDLVFYVCFGDTLVSYNKDSGRWRGHPLKIARKKILAIWGKSYDPCCHGSCKKHHPPSCLMDDLFLYLFSLSSSLLPPQIDGIPSREYRGGKNPQASILGKKGGGGIRRNVSCLYTYTPRLNYFAISFLAT
jgi:hypothetical protein